MAINVSVYNEGILLGTGSMTTTSISTYSGAAPGNGRNVQVVNTSAGANLGRSWQSRVVSGSGTSTLTMNVAAPYA